MENQFETLDTYTLLAKKVISKFAPTFYTSLKKELLLSDDAISDIASALMTADWKWDKNRTGHEGKSKTRYSYRNQCGIWAIKTYISNKYKKKNSNYSIDDISNNDLKTFAANLVDKSISDPYEIAVDKEYHEETRKMIEDLWRSARRLGGGGRLDALEERDQPLLRGDRQEGGRADTLQDLDQRVVARLTRIALPSPD